MDHRHVPTGTHQTSFRIDSAAFHQLLVQHAHQAVLSRPPNDESTPIDGILDNVDTAPGTLSPNSVDEQVKSVADDIVSLTAQSELEIDGRTLRMATKKIVEQACHDPAFCSTSAHLCKHIFEIVSPNFKDKNIADGAGNPITGGDLFKKYLLNQCQAEFEISRERKPGVLPFFAELYKTGILPIRVLYSCVSTLLEFEGLPEDSAVLGLVVLLPIFRPTMGKSEKGKQMMRDCFKRLEYIRNLQNLSKNMRPALSELLDLSTEWGPGVQDRASN